MTFGVDPFGTLGGSSGVSGIDGITQQDVTYLVELFPYDSISESIIRVGFSDPAQRNRSTYFSGMAFPGIVLSPISVETRIFHANLPNQNTESGSSGSIVLQWANGYFDQLAGYFWEGRRVNIYVGKPNWNFASFFQIFTGIIKSVKWDEQTFTLEVGDDLDDLDLPIQENTYTGDLTGENYDNNPALKGTLKPIALGAPRNVPMQLINVAEDVYQWHDGSSEAVDALYDKGILLTKANSGNNDITDMSLANVFAWTKVPGQYVTDLARGILILGAPAKGQITGDVQGANDGDPVAHPRRAADLFRYLLLRAGKTNIDGGSVESMGTMYPSQCSFFTSEKTSYRTIINSVVDSMMGYWKVSPTGTFSIGRFAFTTAETIHRSRIQSVSRVDPGSPIWKLILTYAPNWFQQDADSLSENTPPARREYMIQPSLKVENEESIVKTWFPKSTIFEMTTLLDNSVDAVNQADSRMVLLAGSRHMFQIVLSHSQWKYSPGSKTVGLDWPRWSPLLNSLIVLAVKEDVSAGITTLLAWG